MAEGADEQIKNQSKETFQPDVIINPAAGGMYKPISADAPAETVQPELSAETLSQIKKNESHGGEIILNRVSTYQDAVKEALRTQSVSSASLLMAEDRRRKTAEAVEKNESIKSPQNRWLLIGTAVLVIAGLLVLGYVFLSRNNNTQVDTTRSLVAKKFFESNGVLELAAANLSRNTITKLQQVLASPMTRNDIQQIVITKEVLADPTSSYKITKAVPYTSNEFLSLIKARIDTSFNRSIDQDFFLGAHALAANETFILFKITDFDTVFATMFAWEKAMPDDIEPIFPNALGSIVNNESDEPLLEIPQPIATSIATTTQIATGTSTRPTATSTVAKKVVTATSTSATSTVPKLPQRTTAGLFSDEVISNSDARVIKDVKRNTVFFYAYIDEEYLFIGTKAQTLTEVKKRIRSAKLVI